MTMTQWTYENHELCNGFTSIVYDEHGTAIADYLDEPRARLIAAAPEMLEALRLMKRVIDEALPKFNWGASALNANAIGLLNEAPGAVNAALAKAEGAE